MNIDIIKNAKTQYIGKNIIYYEQIDSTNDEAKRLDNLSNGTIIITDNQTKGRGSKGRVWYGGSKNNIAMTIILIPNCNIKQIDNFTVHVAECIKDAIYELYKYELNIKLPNDLYLNGKKIAGILTEAIWQAGIIKKLIIGIGMNVNEIDFNEEIGEIATSLKKEFNRNYIREEIIVKLIERFEKMWILKN